MMLNLVWGLIILKERVENYVLLNDISDVIVLLLRALWICSLICAIVFIILTPKVTKKSYKRQLILFSVSFVLTLVIPIIISLNVENMARSLIALLVIIPFFIPLYFLYVISIKVKDFYNDEFQRNKFNLTDTLTNIWLFAAYMIFSYFGIITLIGIPFGFIERDPLAILFIIISMATLIGARKCYKYQTLSKYDRL